jgi:CBS domain-containing protein
MVRRSSLPSSPLSYHDNTNHSITQRTTLKDALHIMQQKNIRRLVIVENEKPVGIITNKDLFNVIMNNQSLIPSLLEDKVLVGHKSAIHDQFGQYWFSDVLHSI